MESEEKIAVYKTYSPTIDEWKDFGKFMRRIEQECEFCKVMLILFSDVLFLFFHSVRFSFKILKLLLKPSSDSIPFTLKIGVTLKAIRSF